MSEIFVSNISSADFDRAMTGGLKYANGEWASEAQRSELTQAATASANSVVSGHNTSTVAHNDIRLLIQGLTTRLNTLANSDDTTLDQMAEVVAYIKDNRGLIEGITTSKVSVSDIINNLTTNVSNKPLSAAQGVALKALIDGITVPTKTSQLTNDSGYQTEDQVNTLINVALGVIENGTY